MYGYDAASVHDPAIAAAEKSGVIFLKYMRPGSIYAIMGDRINKLPDWMPGKEFRRDVKLLKVYTDEAKRIPWEFAQKAYVSLPHWAARLILIGVGNWDVASLRSVRSFARRNRAARGGKETGCCIGRSPHSIRW